MATSWEELEQKYGGAAAASPASDPWSALEEKYAAPAAVKSDDKPGKKAESRPAATWLERGMALPAGMNRGVAGLAGLPVDTIANAIDLGKAGIGYLTSKITGNVPPEWTQPTDRRSVVGSSDWIARQINGVTSAAGVRSPIDNPRPDDPLSRVLYSGGQFAGTSVNPNPQAKIGPLQQLMNIGGGAIGGLTGGAVGEVAPDWASLASMSPAIVAATLAGGTKLAVRGREAGRKEMAQRVQDLKAGGIDEPSVGLASGNRTVMGLENLLAQTPFSSEMYQVRGQQNIAGMQNRTNQIRDAISLEFGPVVAGEAMQADLKGLFKDRIGNTYSALNDKVASVVGPNARVPVSESLLKAKSLTTPISGAEETSALLIQQRIKNIQEALQADAGAKPAQTVYVGSRTIQVPAGHHGMKTVQQPGLLDMSGNPITTIIPATPPAGLPFSALKELRTKIGKESQSNAIMGTPEQADFKQLYGAMSQDMKNGVALADIANGRLPTAPGSASTALNRANSFYSKAMNRAEDLNGLATRNTPEGAYDAVARSLNAGPTIYERLRGTIDPRTRQKIVATIIDEMGTASPGHQSAAGDAWSPRTFLTNFARLNEKGGGNALFTRLPGGQRHANNLRDIAKAAEMVGDASKIWANPSGTAPALTARGTFYALTAGAFLHPWGAAATAGGLALGNQASKRLLLNPKFVDWLAKAPTVKPEQMQVHAQRLASIAKFSSDQQFKRDVLEYLQSVQDGAQD